MATLTNKTIASTYTSLLKLEGDTGSTVAGASGDAVQVKTGDNDATPLYLNTDRIGIGTASPSVMLNLESATSTAITAENTGDGAVSLNLDANRGSANQGLGNINFQWNGSTVAQISGSSGADTTNKDDGQIYFSTTSGGSSAIGMTLTKEGYLGVGSSVPNLYEGSANNFVIYEAGNAGLTIAGGTSNVGSIHFADGVSGADAYRGYINYSHDLDSLRFGTDGSERLIISSAGNVGIGVTPEATQSGFDALQIGGNANITSYGTQGASGQVDFGHNYYYSAAGTDKYISTDEATQFRQSAGNFIFRTAPSGTADDAITFTEVAKFDINSRISLSNNDGDANNTTIFGYLAGNSQTSGSDQNCYFGHESGKANTHGDDNVCVGFQSGLALGNGTGSVQNSLVGSLSGTAITEGDYNTFLGYRTGYTGTNDISTGTFNTFIGKGVAGDSATATNQTAIGADVTAQGDNSVTLGNASVTDVYMSQDSGAYVHSQNVPNHVANTMSSPYYRFDGVDDYIEIADSNNLSFTDNHMSVRFVVKFTDITSNILLAKGKSGSGGNWEYYFKTTSADKLQAYFASADTIYWECTGENALTAYENQWMDIVITANPSSDASGCTMYVNGSVYAQAAANEGGGNFTAMRNLGASVKISNYDTYYDARKEMQSVQFFNKVLTATEVKELYSGASVAYKYKGANQTASYTSDFTSGADSWANAGRATVTGNSDSVGGVDDTLKIIADATSGASHYARRNSATATRRAYRIKFDYYIPSGQTVDGFQFGLQTTLNQFSTTGSWQTNVSFEVNDLSSGDLFLYLTDGGSQTVAGNAENEYVALKNITVVPIGAVAEYDGSGAGSKVWGDKSGNDLHGTVSGATLENTPYDSGTEYEEGTWTPVLAGSSTAGTYTYHTQVGRYTKIGNIVHVVGSLWDIATSSAGSPNMRITGLPYTSENVALLYSVGTIGMDNVDLTGVSPFVSIYNDVSFLEVKETVDNGADVHTQMNDITSGSTDMYFQISYRCA